MTVTVYKSTDTSARAHRGVAGDTKLLLEDLLVNGYGSKASQGWTEPFTGTNQAVFKGPSGTNQRCLNLIDDGATTAGAANYARISGYEAETAQNTGTGQFPTTTQVASPGLYFNKSTTADTVARPWFAYGNGKIFYLFTAPDSGTTNPPMGCLFFGDFVSYVASDVYNTILIAGGTTAGGAGNSHGFGAGAYWNTGLAHHYIPRSYTGVGSSVAATKFTNTALAGGYCNNTEQHGIGNWTTLINSSSAHGNPFPYPNPADSGLYMERLWIAETASIRGELPGFWAPLHNNPLLHLDTFSGTGALSGKNFEVMRTGGNINCEVFMETSNTW